jgi:hypothetical protein
MTRRLLLILLLAPLCAAPARAGILFNRKAKPTPNERVPQLLQILKTDGDENKRVSAAEELRQYDPTQFPEMIPALLDALMTDKKPSVRAEAAQTLGKLRPVSQQVGQALEYARDKDAAMRVRLQARSSLLDYRWHGYKPGKNDLPGANVKEPPLVDKPPQPPQHPQPPQQAVKPVEQPVKPVEPRVVVPPPDAKELQPTPVVPPQPNRPQRMPSGPSQPGASPETPPVKEDGPALPLPQE